MAIRIYEVLVKLRADISELTQKLDQAQKAIEAATAEAQQLGTGITQSVHRAALGAEDLTAGITAFQQALAGAGPRVSSFVGGLLSLHNVAVENRLSIAQLTFVMQRLGTITGALGVALSAAFALSLRAATDFDRGMRNVNALLRLSEEQFMRLSESVLDLVRVSPRPLAEFPSSLYELASSGFNASEAVEVLRVASRAATAGLAGLNDAISILVTVLKAYGLTVESAGRVSDVLFRSVDVGRFTFADFAQQGAEFLAIAPQISVSLEEASAAFAFLTLRGFSAAEAATSVAAVFRSLLKPSEALTALIRSLGFANVEAALASKGFVGVLRDIAAASKGSATELGRMFPEARALRGIVPILSNDMRDFAVILDKVRDSSGATAVAFEEQSKSFAVQSALLRNNIQTLAVQLSNTFLPALTLVTGAVSGVVGKLIEFLGVFPTLKHVITAVLSAFAILSTTLGAFFALLAPIILLLNAKFIPLLHVMAQRFGLLTSAIKALFNLRIMGIFGLFAVAFDILDKALSNALSNFLEFTGEFGTAVGSVITGAKSVGQAFVDFHANIARATLEPFAQRVPAIRDALRKFLHDMNELNRQAAVATSDQAQQIIASVSRIRDATKEGVTLKLRLLGFSPQEIRIVESAIDRVAESVLKRAQAAVIDLSSIFNQVITDFERVFGVFGDEIRNVKVSFGDSVVSVEQLKSELEKVPSVVQQIDQELRAGNISYDEAVQRVNELRARISDLVVQIKQVPVKTPFVVEGVLVEALVRSLEQLGVELGKVVIRFGEIRSQKLTPQIEDVEQLRKELEVLNSQLERMASLARSQANLEIAIRMQAARRMDELIFLEELRARTILDINVKLYDEMLKNVREAQRKIVDAVAGANKELADIDRALQGALTDQQRRELEERRAALLRSLEAANEDLRKVNIEENRILVEQNEVRARFYEAGAKRVVEILEQLREEGRRVTIDMSRTFVELNRAAIEAAGEAGADVVRRSVGALVQVLQSEGTRVVEVERDIQATRNEILRDQLELRRVLVTSAFQSEIQAIESRMRRFETAMEVERRLLEINLRMFEFVTNREIQLIDERMQRELEALDAHRRQLEVGRISRTAREQMLRQIEMRERQIREDAARQRQELEKRIERERILAELAALEVEEKIERERLQTTRARAEAEISSERAAVAMRLEQMRLETEGRIQELSAGLRIREIETQRSIELARLETRARIEQARFELQTKLSMIAAEIRARVAAGQISLATGNQILAQLNVILTQFEQWAVLQEQIALLQESRLLAVLGLERDRVQQIVGMLERQLQLRRQIAQTELLGREREIVIRLQEEIERILSRLRVIAREREFGRIRLEQFEPRFFVPDFVAPLVGAGEKIVDAYDSMAQKIVETAVGVVNALRGVGERVAVQLPRVSVGEALPMAPVVNINVSGTRIELTPNEEALFTEFIRMMLGPEGRRIFDQWGRRAV